MKKEQKFGKKRKKRKIQDQVKRNDSHKNERKRKTKKNNNIERFSSLKRKDNGHNTSNDETLSNATQSRAKMEIVFCPEGKSKWKL